MNRKQFIILLVFVAVIGGAGWIIHQRNNQSWQSGGDAIGRKLLPNLAVNDIAQIQIQSGTNVLHLVKHDNLWRVAERDNYPADFSKISDLLLKISGLKVVQSDQIGPSQLGLFDLLPPGPGTNTATQVDFKNDSGSTLNMLLLGKQHLQQPPANSQFGGEGWPDGRYVMDGTGAKTVDVIFDPLESVQAAPAQWLNKDFLSIAKPRSIEVQFARATNSWKLTRASETNEWELADAKAGEKLDATKISSVTSPFSSVNFDDVAPLNSKNNGATNETVLTVETFDGFTYVAKIGSKHDQDYPVSFTISAKLPTESPAAKDEKPEEKANLDKAFKTEREKLAAQLARDKSYEGWVYSLPVYSVDKILKIREQLLAEQKKPDSTPENKKPGS